MIPIGFKLKVDGSEFKQSMDGLKRDMLSVFALDKVKGAMDDLIAKARVLKKMHDDFGVPQDVLQAQAAALEAQGKSISDLDNLYFHLNKSRKAALESPTGEQAAIFKSVLGLDGEALAKIDSDKLAAHLFKAFSEMGAKAEPYFAAIFGKGSQDMLEKLGDRFTKLQEDFLKLGIVLEQNTIEQLVEFSYTLNQVKVTLQYAFGWIVQAVADIARYVGVITATKDSGKTILKESLNPFTGGLVGAIAREMGKASTVVDSQKLIESKERSDAEALKKATEESKLAAMIEKINAFKIDPDKVKAQEREIAKAAPSLSSLQQIGAYAGGASKTEQIAAQQLQKTDMMAQAIDRLQRDVQSIRNSFNM